MWIGISIWCGNAEQKNKNVFFCVKTLYCTERDLGILVLSTRVNCCSGHYSFQFSLFVFRNLYYRDINMSAKDVVYSNVITTKFRLDAPPSFFPKRSLTSPKHKCFIVQYSHLIINVDYILIYRVRHKTLKTLNTLKYWHLALGLHHFLRPIGFQPL